MSVDAANKAAERAAPDEHGELSPLRDKNPHHLCVRPLPRVFIYTRPLHDSEGWGNGQYANPDRGLACFADKTSGIEAIEPGQARIGIRKVQGQGPQIAAGGHK